MPFLPEDLLSADAACLPVVAEVETNGQGDKGEGGRIISVAGQILIDIAMNLILTITLLTVPLPTSIVTTVINRTGCK